MQTIYPAIDQVSKELIRTKPAAYYLDKNENTMRKWACGATNGPAGLRPVRVGHHLLWPVATIKAILRGDL